MKKILVRTPQWLGDAVVCTIFLSRLKETRKDATLAVLTTPALIPLFSSHPAVDLTLPLPYSNSGTVRDAAKIIRDQSFDEIYILPRSFRTVLEAWLAGVPKRIGFGGDLRRLLLTDIVSYEKKALYPHRYLKLLGDENLSLTERRPHFPIAVPSDEEILQILGSDLASLPKPFFGIAPASIAPSRTWDENRFAEVGQSLLAKAGGTLFIFGSKQEEAVAQRIKSKITGSIIDTSGRLNLPQLGWLLGRMSVFIANDSGLMHVASALNVPTVVLFGASDPSYALPVAGRFLAIQHPEVSCVPCLRNHCVRMGNHHLECLKAISKNEVLETVNHLLST